MRSLSGVEACCKFAKVLLLPQDAICSPSQVSTPYCTWHTPELAHIAGAYPRVLTIYMNHLVGNFMRKHFMTDLGFTEEGKGSKLNQIHEKAEKNTKSVYRPNQRPIIYQTYQTE